MTTAAKIEITTGSLVRVAANKRAEVLNRPSARLLARDADQSLLKAGPRDSVLAFGVDIRASTLVEQGTLTLLAQLGYKKGWNE
jgi:hypothetical protein